MTATLPEQKHAAWNEELIAGRAVRLGGPLSKAGEVLSVRAGMEFLNVLPPSPEVAILELVSRYTVGADVQIIDALAETDRPTGADIVPEAGVKPVLVGGVGGVRLPLDTFAAQLTLPKNRLADRPYLEGLIANLLRQALVLSAWQHLLAAAFANADVPEMTGTIRDGQMRVEHGHVPNAVAIHPDDWQVVEEGLPQKMAPVEELVPGVYLPMYGPLWVYSTGLIDTGKTLVGDFRGLALVTQPQAALSVSYAHDQTFTRNEVTLRLEQMGKAMVSAPARLFRILPATPPPLHRHGRYGEPIPGEKADEK